MKCLFCGAKVPPDLEGQIIAADGECGSACDTVILIEALCPTCGKRIWDKAVATEYLYYQDEFPGISRIPKDVRDRGVIEALWWYNEDTKTLHYLGDPETIISSSYDRSPELLEVTYYECPACGNIAREFPSGSRRCDGCRSRETREISAEEFHCLLAAGQWYIILSEGIYPVPEQAIYRTLPLAQRGLDRLKHCLGSVADGHVRIAGPFPTRASARLAGDLTAAAKLARYAAAEVDDTGTCNLDAVFVRLPQIDEAGVKAAAEEAGLIVTKIERHSIFGTGYLIHPPSVGQADKRTAAAKAVHHSLDADDYDVDHWHQTD